MLRKYSNLLLLSLLSATATSAYAEKSIGYWYDTAGKIVHTGFGKCWRTNYWAESNALAECEGGAAKQNTVVAAAVENDADKDGVADAMDKCPGTAAGVTVDATGCVMDADKDGVVDAADKCPATPAGAKVDATGCGMDSDKDGIADASDECPGTEAGTVVNNRGCKLQESIDLKSVQFKTGTNILSGSSKSTLDGVAATLISNPHLKFEVAGHTDNTGNAQKNLNLSEKRANSVRQYLIDKGVAADRLSARGYGSEKPVADNATADGRSKNRRVELVLQ